MRSSGGGKYRSCRLVLRLPFSTGADNHKYYGSYSEAAIKQRGHPGPLARGVSKREEGVWWQRPATCGSEGNVENRYCFARVFICLDALDECLPKHLPDLLESLRDIVRESPRTRIFLTGRSHVREDVQRYFSKAVVIPVSPSRGDIRNYVKMRLDRDTEPEAMSNDLRVDIVRVILGKISNV